jgi:hypothetical protein
MIDAQMQDVARYWGDMARIWGGSDWLGERSTGRLALVTLALFVGFMVLVLPDQARRAAQYAGAAGSPDGSFWYAPAELYRMAEAYGPAGRQAYVIARFTFDLVWPMAYTLFLSVALGWALWRATPGGGRWRRLNLLPVAGAAFDYCENIAAATVIGRYPAVTPVLDHLAPVWTALKWSCIYVSFAVLPAALVAALIVSVRRR